MKTTLGGRKGDYVARLGVFFAIAALTVGIAGCGCNQPPSQNLEIWTWYDLDAVRHNLGGNHRLMNDLDSATPGYADLASSAANAGVGWEPIGTFDPHDSAKAFAGVFDGQGYVIKDLFIYRPEEDYVGLFGCGGREGFIRRGVIKNVGLTAANVTGRTLVGVLAGLNIAAVTNCYSNGNVTGESSVGGLVGTNWRTVGSTYSSANVAGGSAAGGLAGANSGTLSNSYSIGNVIGERMVGGLVGANEGTVSDSYSAGSVTGQPWLVGGLIGSWSPPGSSKRSFVSNSFWDTQTSGQPDSFGATGKTTAEMKRITTFSGAAWNITTVAPGERNPVYTWNIVDGQTYPFLSWQPVS